MIGKTLCTDATVAEAGAGKKPVENLRICPALIQLYANLKEKTAWKKPLYAKKYSNKSIWSRKTSNNRNYRKVLDIKESKIKEDFLPQDRK